MGQYIFIGVYTLFLCLFAHIAFAQDSHNVTRLNNTNVEAFVQDVTNRANDIGSYEPEDLSSFFERHLHSNAFFKSSMSYLIPGYPSQKNSVSFNKEKYIETLLTTDSTVDDFEAEVTVSNIQISKDKKKATLETVTTENAVMKVPQNGSVEYVPMTGVSKCRQILMLSNRNDIQIYSANCETQMSFDGGF